MSKAEYILLRQYVSEPPIASPLGRRSSEGAKHSGRVDRETGGGSPTVREGVDRRDQRVSTRSGSDRINTPR